MLLFIRNLKNIKNGFYIFLNVLTGLLAKFSDIIPVTDEVTLSKFAQTKANNAFFCFLAVIFAFFIAFTIIKFYTIQPTLILSVASFSLCLIFIKNKPDTVPIIIFFVFLTSLILISNIKKGHKNYHNYMFLKFIPLMLVFFILITRVFPEDTYNREGVGDKMYTFFSGLLPINIKEQKNTSTDESSYDGSDNSGQNVSGNETSEPNPGIQNDYHGINLSGAEPLKNTESTVLRILSDKPGKFLLRGFSLDIYTGSSWAQFDKSVKSELEFSTWINMVSEQFPDGTIANPISFATYSAMMNEGEKPGRLQIIEEKNGGEISYTPYYPVFLPGNIHSYITDYAVFNTYNNSNNEDVKAKYSFYTFEGENILNNESYTKNPYISQKNYDQINQYEQLYRDAVNRYYTRVKPSTKEFLYEFIDGDSFLQITDRAELVEKVCDYVKSCAKYNINTEPTPMGRDYVEYFLTQSGEGYCMHFATTATMIFRTLGVPARYVSGYAANVKAKQINQYIDVTEKNAHAWVEVYFDGVGWIPVDVTPGYDDPDISSDNTSNTNSGTTSGNIPSTDDSDTSSRPDISGVSDPSNTGESSVSQSEDSSSSADDSSDVKGVIPRFFEDNKTIIIIVTSLLLLCLMIFTVVYLRFSARKKRKNAFSQANNNRAVIEAWCYISKLKAYGAVPEKYIYKLAQKAAFSKHTLTSEEARFVTSYAEKTAKEIDEKLKLFGRIKYRYIKRLY